MLQPLREVFGDAVGDGGARAGLLDGDAVAERAIDRKIMLSRRVRTSSLSSAVRIGSQRSVFIGHVRSPDDGDDDGFAGEAHRLAGDSRIGAETALPESVRDHGNTRGLCVVIRGDQRPSEQWLHLQRREHSW